MARLGPVFFDTTVLVAGLIEIGGSADPSLRIMDAVAETRIRRPTTAWHCCLEFYSVSTRLPEDLRLAPEDALRLLEEEVLSRFHVHQLPERIRRGFFRDAVRERVMGGRIYDAHIAEIARLSGARTIVTDNGRHFSALERHGIRILSSAEFARTLD